MTAHTDPAGVARGLSAAQRRYLTTKAEWHSPALGHPKRWMTFPPAATHRVLCALGLTDRSGQILNLGLAVRACLVTPDAPPTSTPEIQ